MPKSDNQKLKILYIKEYLEKNSSPERPVRASELIDMLENRYAISCERKTIYADIEALKSYGMDIVAIPGKNGGYYLESGVFEPSEIRLLINAIQSSRYLTQNQSHALIQKLYDQCSMQDASLLCREFHVSGRVKTTNDSVYNNVDHIQDAIANNRQISFRYFDWGIDGQRHYRENSYIASPYGICQDNEYCYLLAWSDRHQITQYRVDRMSHIKTTNDPRIPCPELTGNAFHDYANRLFQMYSGETMQVKLRFHRKLANAAIDRFGKDLIFMPDPDGEHFTFNVNVVLSPMFYSWIIGFGDMASILNPQIAVDGCTALCRQVLELY